MESICDAQSREDGDVVTVFRQAKRKSKMERGKKNQHCWQIYFVKDKKS